MREENNNSSKSKEQSLKQSVMRKRWFAPAIYLAVVALVLSAVFFMQGVDESAAPEEGVNVVDPSNEEYLSQYGEEAVPVTAANEVVKMPVASEDEVEVIGYFYDVNATTEEQEAALVYYNNMYYQNKGIDFAKPEGGDFDVIAALSGTVIKAEQDELLGNVIEISHDNGIITHYHSLETINVEEGATVKQGDTLGLAGRNLYNKDAGVHVHFELRYEGTPVNPHDFFEQPIDSIGETVKEKEAEKEEAAKEEPAEGTEDAVEEDEKEAEEDAEKEADKEAETPDDSGKSAEEAENQLG